MTSNRPYLIRALYEWLLDNGLTPHLLVDAGHKSVVVPQQFVEDGRIVLNINPSAVMNLVMSNEMISFNARFGGRETDVFVPPLAVLGIYARENGRGMLFPDELEEVGDDEPDDTNPTGPAGSPKGKGRPSLKVVK
jgi:stringent starvation protein B